LLLASGIISLLGNFTSSISGYLTEFNKITDRNDSLVNWFIKKTQDDTSCCGCTPANILNVVFTFLGVCGSIVTLVGADLSISPKNKVLIAGGIISIVCNLISSVFAHLTPYPSGAAGASGAPEAPEALEAPAAPSGASVQQVLQDLPLDVHHIKPH